TLSFRIIWRVLMDGESTSNPPSGSSFGGIGRVRRDRRIVDAPMTHAVLSSLASRLAGAVLVFAALAACSKDAPPADTTAAPIAADSAPVPAPTPEPTAASTPAPAPPPTPTPTPAKPAA